MAHPQNSPRGLFSKKTITISGSTFDASSISFNSTAALVAVGLRLSNKTNTTMTANTTGFIASGAMFVSGQATMGKLSANSTALILPNSVRVGTKTTYFSSNSTGVKLGSLYISCNSTGNTTT